MSRSKSVRSFVLAWLVFAAISFLLGRLFFLSSNTRVDSSVRAESISSERVSPTDPARSKLYKATAIPASPSPQTLQAESVIATATGTLSEFAKQGPIYVVVAVTDRNSLQTKNRAALILLKLDIARRAMTVVSIAPDLPLSLTNRKQESVENLLTRVQSPNADISSFKQALEQNFSVAINYYFVLERSGLEQTVDRFGGFELAVPAISNGQARPVVNVTSNGQLRSGTKVTGSTVWPLLTDQNGTGGGDQMIRVYTLLDGFLRMIRSQGVIDQSLSLLVELTAQYQTNLQPNQLVALTLFAQSIPTDAVSIKSVDSNWTKSEAGVQVLDRDKVRALFAEPK